MLLYNMYHVFIAVSTAPMSIFSCSVSPLRKDSPDAQMIASDTDVSGNAAQVRMHDVCTRAGGVDRFALEQCIGGVDRFAIRMHAW